jgi:hypothetical protein
LSGEVLNKATLMRLPAELANMRIVSDQQTLVSYPEIEDLCIEDYLECDDPTFFDQDHAAR